MEFFNRQKEDIAAFISDFLQQKQQAFAQVNPWGEDVVTRLIPFISSGKMLRGGLVNFGFLLGQGAVSANIFPAAAAVELIQAALLVHDDIIDRDRSRRGSPSIYYQYVKMGQDEGMTESDHFGQGMGICLGDIGFFLAFELFSRLSHRPEAKERIVNLWSQELCFVGLAQMQDLYNGETDSEIQEEEILRLYRYKTARYSFSLPLMTGAILGGADEALMSSLEKCGIDFGLLFQLKDDELGLYGTEEELGKPVGSDIRECKKTLHSLYLHRLANAQDQKRYAEISRSEDLSPDLVEEVRDMLKKYGIDAIIRERMLSLRTEIEKEIRGLKLHPEYEDILFQLLEYSQNRSK
jgi:geranylgeranyl diphosphate synthase type I